MKRMARIAWGALALLCLCSASQGHELQANRLTVVQRDARHLSLAFYIDYADALHLALAPARSFQEFAMAHASMKPEELAQALKRAQARFEAGVRITLTDGKPLPALQWRWPEPARVQALLQEHVMRMVVAPADHAHPQPTEIHAELQAPGDVIGLRLQLPAEFQSVLVVSYRPQQAWARPGAPALTVKF